MSSSIFNHNKICYFLFHGNTLQAIDVFIKKTNPEEFNPFLRNSYLSSLNFGIYNYVLARENISLHECCMENEHRIATTTAATFLDTGIAIITAYANDSHYIAEKYSNPHIRAAISYIHKHLCEPLSLEEVSRIAYVNSSYFSDLFKREVGCCFVEYIQKQRIQLSKKLLHGTTLSIQEIAEQCGFQSSAYFATCFRKHTNFTPSYFRSLAAS